MVPVLNKHKHINQYGTLLIALLLAFFYTVQYMHRHADRPVGHAGSTKNLVNECAICHIVHADRMALPLFSGFTLKAPEKLLLRPLREERKFSIPGGFDARKSNKDPPC